MKIPQRSKYLGPIAIFSALCLVPVTRIVAAPNISVSNSFVEDARDTRPNPFAVGLRIGITVKGALLAQARALRAVAKTATDETGQNLIVDPETLTLVRDFETLDARRTSEVRLALMLKSPARKAMVVSQVTGELEIYLPHNDPASVVIKDLRSQTGKPLASPTLKAQGLSVVALTREQYQQYKKKAASKSVDAALSQGLVELFDGMFGGSGSKKNTVVFHIEDPNERLVQISFVDAHGKEIKNNGHFSQTGNGSSYHTFNFDKKLPADARIKLYIATPKSITKVPFQLKDLQLP